MTYVIEVQEDDNGDCFITLPDEVLEDLGWQEGDVLNYDFRGEGIVITKLNDINAYEVIED
jgi:bifunctional DNA-binding transcriptional regulator/antitoxin component of YhaV-PrlF toxin-antitoxin module